MNVGYSHKMKTFAYFMLLYALLALACVTAAPTPTDTPPAAAPAAKPAATPATPAKPDTPATPAKPATPSTPATPATPACPVAAIKNAADSVLGKAIGDGKKAADNVEGDLMTSLGQLSDIPKIAQGLGRTALAMGEIAANQQVKAMELILNSDMKLMEEFINAL